jgi:hypothetical protein
MIEIVDATPDGIPSRCVCPTCHPSPESVWTRPADDPSGHSLWQFVRLHHRKPNRYW